jgi:hypothetical protein
MFGKALYYPTIDVEDTTWLKSAMLFWDSIHTIAPKSIENPYQLPETMICANEGYLSPIHPEVDQDILDELGELIVEASFEHDSLNNHLKIFPANLTNSDLDASDVYKTISSNAYETIRLRSGKISRTILRNISTHVLLEAIPDKMKFQALLDKIDDIGRLNFKGSNNPEYEQVTNQFRSMFRDKSLYDDTWITMESDFANVYLSALALKLGEKHTLSPLTNNKMAASLNRSMISASNYRGEYASSDSTLLSLVMEGIQIDPETPIKKIIAFRQKRSHQLAELAGHFDELKQTFDLENDLTDTHLNAQKIMCNKIQPGLKKLKSELKSQSIQSIWNGIHTATTFSIPTSSAAAYVLSEPLILGATAAVTLANLGMKHYTAKQQAKRNSPYTYLLDLEKKFALPK